MGIRFGTDGWRGIIADDFTIDNVRVCVQAIAAYLGRHDGPARGLVVGYDTRFASERFARAAAEVLAANNIPVHLCQNATPTPTVSFSIKQLATAGAVIITASHNPADYNGVKFRPDYAGAASDEVLAEIQANIARVESGEIPVQRVDQSAAEQSGLLSTFDPWPDYFREYRIARPHGSHQGIVAPRRGRPHVRRGNGAVSEDFRWQPGVGPRDPRRA